MFVFPTPPCRKSHRLKIQSRTHHPRNFHELCMPQDKPNHSSLWSLSSGSPGTRKSPAFQCCHLVFCESLGSEMDIPFLGSLSLSSLYLTFSSCLSTPQFLPGFLQFLAKCYIILPPLPCPFSFQKCTYLNEFPQCFLRCFMCLCLFPPRDHHCMRSRFLSTVITCLIRSV